MAGLANILCPGPSLGKVPIPEADLTIAVNRAVLYGPADWWVAKDYPVIRDHREQIRGKLPEILTLRHTLDKFQLYGMSFEDLAEMYPYQLKWDHFSACAALLLAHFIGADRARVYGADWTPDYRDWDGVKVLGVNRTNERWSREAESWGNVVGWLQGKMDVERIRP